MSLDITLINEPRPHCGNAPEPFSANITHNMTEMANAVGLYKPLWRPDEYGIKTARDLIAPLEAGIEKLKDTSYDRYNAENGWGTRKGFVPWLERLLDACKANPTATVESDV
jgi:hypothetical protein